MKQCWARRVMAGRSVGWKTTLALVFAMGSAAPAYSDPGPGGPAPGKQQRRTRAQRGPCTAGQAHVIRPGREKEILALLAHLWLGQTLSGGWEIESMRVVISRIEYTLVRGSARFALVLSPPIRRGVAGQIATSSSFVISARPAPGTGDRRAREVARALAARVKANDSGTFWRNCAGGKPVAAGHGWLLWFNRALLVLMVVLAVFCFGGLRAALGEQGRGYWLAMLGILVLAVALRGLIPPWVPLHGNTHGIREMRELLVGQDALIPNLLVGQYGYAKHALLSALVALAGSTAGALFWINIALGSLTPLALGLATTLAFRSRLAGLLAALLLACLPAHVGLSSSESGLVAYNLLLASSLVVAQVAVREGSLRQLLLLGLLVGFAAQLHAVAVAAPCLAFVALLYDPRGSSWRQMPWWRLLVAAGLTVAILAPHAMKMMADYWQPGRERADIISLEIWSSTSNLLFNAAVTPALAPLLCLAGLFVWGRSRWLAALIWGVAILAFSWLHNIICVSFSDAIRYQATPLMLTLPPAAYALARLAGRCEGGLLRARPVLAAVAALAALGSALPGLQLVSEVHNEALEYDFLRRTIPKLPSAATLVLVDERLADGKVITDFPDFLLLEQGKRLDIIRRGELTRRTRRTRGPLILYLGLTCYSFTVQEVRARSAGGGKPLTVRPECLRLRQKYNLRPLAEESFRSRRLRWSSARSYYFQQIPAETLTIGFYYLMEGRGKK